MKCLEQESALRAVAENDAPLSAFRRALRRTITTRRAARQAAGAQGAETQNICRMISNPGACETNHVRASAPQIKRITAQDGGRLDSEIREILDLSRRSRPPASSAGGDGGKDAVHQDACQTKQEAATDTRNLVSVIGFWRRVRIGGGDTIMIDIRGADPKSAALATSCLLQRYSAIFTILVQAMRDGARRIEIEIGADSETVIATMSAHETLHEKERLMDYLIERA